MRDYSRDLVALRNQVGINQQMAANLLKTPFRTYQRWEQEGSRMHTAFMELLRFKCSAPKDVIATYLVEVNTEPTPAEIKSARLKYGIEEPDLAGQVIYMKDKTWYRWESGKRKMKRAFLELFYLKQRTPTPIYEQYAKKREIA
ncbi:hypothetical protein [Stutzerimonas kunmingensis]|uniref:hypothetical protein n=1 Tax=Stutzerimonas kunmingensis TaxID=1211807 RepID=UPI0028A96D6F|nr:hypothetical protein [Stutzerimonas kunmingensis]